MQPAIDRGFVRVDSGLIHYRTAGWSTPGGPPPLYMAHAGPGSSRGLAPVIAVLSQRRRVIAPDMMGNGDSDAHPKGFPDIADYAANVVEVMDTLQVEQADFYGDHTGAQIGCEFAIRYPERLRRLVLDGAPLFPRETKAELLERYAPPVAPDDFGGHLAWCWRFVSDLYLHFPWYARDPAHRLGFHTVPPASDLQPLVVDLLKALPTYHLAYRAAFAHPTAERLPLIRRPTLAMAVEGDPLGLYLESAAALIPGASKARVARPDRAAAIAAFLDGDEDGQALGGF